MSFWNILDLYFYEDLRKDIQKIMSQLDSLNAGIASIQADQNAEDTNVAALETLGGQIQASIALLQQQQQAGVDLSGAIAAVQAIKVQNDARLAKLNADLSAGTTYEGSLPQAGAAPVTGTPVVAPVSADVKKA